MKAYKKYFVNEIRSRYPDRFDALIAQTDAHYFTVSKDTAFASASENPIDKRLDFSAYFLALIITLDKAGESYDKIREICLAITTAYVQPGNKLQALIKKLIPKLINTWIGRRMVRSLHRKVSINSNTDGFVANILTDKQETYGFGYGIDILECGICKLFKKHNYQKYASILCEVDEITSGLAGLKLIRTGTIANGAKKCDFRFQPVSK